MRLSSIAGAAGIGAGLAAIVVFIAILVIGAIDERKAWNAYAAQHCKVIGHMDGDVGVGNTFGANGQVGVAVVVTGDKIGFKCDDGMTYWKEQ